MCCIIYTGMSDLIINVCYKRCSRSFFSGCFINTFIDVFLTNEDKCALLYLHLFISLYVFINQIFLERDL